MDYDKILLIADWVFHGILGAIVGLLYFSLLFLVALLPLGVIAALLKKK